LLVLQLAAGGWSRLEQHDSAAALAWFAEALQAARGDPALELTGRMRVRAVSEHCPGLLGLWPHPGAVKQVEFSADGHRLLAVCEQTQGKKTQGTLVVWDVRAGKRLAGHDHPGTVTHAALAPDGARVAWLDTEGAVWLAGVGGGKPRRLALAEGL